MFQVTWQDAAAWKRQEGELALPAPPPDPAVSSAGLLCWEEHCVECAMPQCYATCSLFVPRADRKCARFVYGIVPNHQVQGLFGFGADIRFRRWAKLQTAWPAQLAMLGTRTLRAQTLLIDQVEKVVSFASNLIKRWSPKRRLNGAFTLARRRLIEKQSALLAKRQTRPDAFLVKCYSPESTPFRIQLELVTDVPVFRTSLQISPGWNEHILHASELIGPASGKSGMLRLSIENDREVRLIFTWLDFVQLTEGVDSISQLNGSRISSPAASTDIASISIGSKNEPTQSLVPAKTVKCVAWDLDNTLWHGVIGDAGSSGVTANQQMIDLIHQLDERGILQTIVSKNNYENAWPKIEQLGLADYFLYPAIHWGPKSRSVQQIADELNINVDTFAVIDDSPFERHEVSNALPQVRVFDPADGAAILNDSSFDVTVSGESRGRRLTYLTEAKRKRVHQSWRGDYSDFLRSCQMSLQIRHPQVLDHSRCIELLQRSNQFNLTGCSYQPEDFHDLLQSDLHDCFCFEVSDNFGDYGIVGFAAFEATADGPQLVDFVMSCRVAQKMVEATFVAWYAARQQNLGHQQLLARLRVTSRNAPLREVLRQLGFECLKNEQDLQLLHLAFKSEMVVPDVMVIHDQTTVSVHFERAVA